MARASRAEGKMSTSSPSIALRRLTAGDGAAAAASRALGSLGASRTRAHSHAALPRSSPLRTAGFSSLPLSGVPFPPRRRCRGGGNGSRGAPGHVRANRAMWDSGNDEREPAYRAYVPVPGFGEYYAPPRADKDNHKGRDKGRDGAEPPRLSTSKLRRERTGPGQRQPRPPPPLPPRPGGFNSAAAAAAEAAAAAGQEQVPVAAAARKAGSASKAAFAAAAAAAAVAADGHAAARHDTASDDGLARLRTMWALFQKTLVYLRRILPLTGGFACWVAAAQNFGSSGGTLAAMQPVMMGAVTLSMFAAITALGAAAFTGGYVFLTLLARVLRNMFQGGMEGAATGEASRASHGNSNSDGGRKGSRHTYGNSEGYGYDTRSAPVDFASMSERVASAVKKGAPPLRVRGGGGLERQTVAPTYYDRDDAPASASYSEPNLATSSSSHLPHSFGDADPFVADPPFVPHPHRPRVDLPIETLMQMSAATLQRSSDDVSTTAVDGESRVNRSGSRQDAFDNGWDGSSAAAADNVAVPLASATSHAAAWLAAPAARPMRTVQEATEPTSGAVPVPDLSRFQRLRGSGAGAMRSAMEPAGDAATATVDPVLASLAWDPPASKSAAADWPLGREADTGWEDMKQRRVDWQRRVERTVKRMTEDDSR